MFLPLVESLPKLLPFKSCHWHFPLSQLHLISFTFCSLSDPWKHESEQICWFVAESTSQKRFRFGSRNSNWSHVAHEVSLWDHAGFTRLDFKHVVLISFPIGWYFGAQSFTQLLWSHAIASCSPSTVKVGHLRIGSVLVPFRPQNSEDRGWRALFLEERSFA